MSSGTSLFQLLVDRVDDYAIFAMDLEARVVHWNRGAHRVTGYSAEDVLGKRVDLIFTPEDIAAGAPSKELEATRRLGKAADERWHVRKDGSRFWAYGLMTKIESETGEHLGYGKFLRDRTDLKQLQEMLERQNETMKKFEEGRRRFLATLAHEIRTPLTVLSASAHALRRLAGSSETIQAELGRVDRQVRLVSNLVNDLADLSRAEHQKIRLERRRIDLRTPLRESCEAVQSLATERDHVVEMVLPDHPVMVEADAARIQQVVVNLLNNAIRYTPPGGDIGLSLQQEGDEAVMRITDNGIGIPAERVGLIFELFTQAHEDYSETRAGFGIGLNLARELVRLHGGSIQARSEGPHKGSEFIVRLPVAATPA